MKGVVFTEFVEFVEQKYGFDTLDAIIESSGVSGVYTQAGNYPFEEMVSLLVSLSERENVEVATLLEVYGEHLFARLATIYPHMDKFTSTLDVVSHIDNIIHPEVQKLYPDAELPSFLTKESNEVSVVLEYHSKKGLQNLAKGLILGAAAYYGESVDVEILKCEADVILRVKRL